MNSGTLIEDISYASSLGDALKLTNNIKIDRQYDTNLDSNQYIGWEQQTTWNPLIQALFSKKTRKIIRDKVSEYTTGVDPKGRKIVPSDNVVETALYGVFNNYHPRTGDIYGKYLVVNPDERNDYAAIVDQTISLLVRGITNEIGMIEQNSKLSIWNSVSLGEGNSIGLRAHPPLKMRERRPDSMLFNMHY
jgi:hypothetical protein